MTPRRVAVTGVGMVSPFGDDADGFFARMTRGESAVTFHVTDDKPRGLALPAVLCPHFDAEATFGRALAGTMDRFTQLGAGAAFAAWQNAGLPFPDRDSKADGGVYWGTGLGGAYAFERGYRDLWQNGRERISPMAVVLGMSHAAAAHISIQLGLGNASLTYSLACSSAAAAIGEGFHRIRSGLANLMVVGGSDAPLAYGVVRAWEALRVLAIGDAQTAATSCRPFHPGRTGLVLGEGAAALVLEDWERAQARGAPIIAEIVGYGAASDHKHLVRPDEAGQVRALRAVLADAGLDGPEVGYVNAHGTATPDGDIVEIAALRGVFGERAASLPVSATKSMHGHLMGAAGAVEALITVLALRDGILPPTAHLDVIDEHCQGVHHIRGAALTGHSVDVALSNSFAFGGSNVVLAFRGAHAH
jgi:3-oxoacyl-[acyl-carrier-protein] synthase II